MTATRCASLSLCIHWSSFAFTVSRNLHNSRIEKKRRLPFFFICPPLVAVTANGLQMNPQNFIGSNECKEFSNFNYTCLHLRILISIPLDFENVQTSNRRWPEKIYICRYANQLVSSGRVLQWAMCRILSHNEPWWWKNGNAEPKFCWPIDR